MASTSALYTGLSGMNVHARRLDVIGNNIANANTTAFKSSRMMFATQFSRTFSNGSAPSGVSGGSNPGQVGLGVRIAGTQRDFTGGAISATGDQRDLAIEGRGFFVIERGGQQLYTRAGSFRQNANNDLVTIDGDRVMGYGVDSNFNILPGALRPINIPVGSLTLAEATRNVRFSGNLKADGDAATQGAQVGLGSTATAGFGVIPTATVPPTAPNILEPASLLSELADPSSPAAPMFTVGQRISLNGAEKGNRPVPEASLTIGATTTVQDLMTFLTQALGLNSSTGANPNGPTPGVTLDTLTGRLTITGNTGSVNNLAIDSTDLQLLDSAGVSLGNPFNANRTAEATGESTRTTFIVYDSLGSPISADMTMVLESKGPTGTTWRYYVDSEDDSDASPNVATGTVSFDANGQLSTSGPIGVSIDRAGTGAATPLAFDIEFSEGADNVTSLSSSSSAIAATYQDGSPIGTLSNFGIGSDGVIIGSFTNGIIRTLGQVAVATFANQEGLIDDGANNFRIGPNSGNALIASAGTFGTGQVVGGALELSNVDLGQEFINMILTSTGYSASSRVIRTADELLQQLMVLGR